MKKLLLIAGIAIFGLGNVNAQENSYGVTAGFQSTSLNLSLGSISENSTDSGYFIGLFAEFSLSENLSLQPEFHYSCIFNDGESLSDLIIPVLLKYNISEKFNVMAGPQFDYITDGDIENFKKFGLGLGVGLGYDITDNILISSRYSFGISNRVDMPEIPADFTAKFNILQIGLGYRF